jgi:hypothetical protein
MGNAVKLAAEDARDKLAKLAAEVGLPAGTNYDVPEIFRRRYGMRAGNVIGVGTYVPKYTPPDAKTGESANVTPFWMIGGAGAEVEVDTETGHCGHARRQCRGRRACDQSENLRQKLRGGATMQLGSPSRNYGVRWRPGHQRLFRRL